MLWVAIFDAGHVPLYGLVSLAILRVLEAAAPRRSRGAAAAGRRDGPRIRLYVASFFLAVGTGVLAEVAQGLTGGDASAIDAARDAAGASAFLLIACALDLRRIHGASRGLPAMLAILAVLPLAIAFATLAGTIVDTIQRDAAFPLICDFESRWAKRFISTNGVDLAVVPPPPGWGGTQAGAPPLARGEHVARLAIREGKYPGFAIVEPHPDWRGYERLAFQVFSELPGPTDLVLRIHDRGHNEDYDDRFNRDVVIAPGANHVEIPLQDVENAPRGRKMDMARIAGVVFFAHRPPSPFTIYVGAFRLE